jgi:hypothetical protein
MRLMMMRLIVLPTKIEIFHHSLGYINFLPYGNFEEQITAQITAPFSPGNAGMDKQK